MTAAELKASILDHAVHGLLVPQEEGRFEKFEGFERFEKSETAAQLLAKIAAEKKHLLASGKIKKQKPLPPLAEQKAIVERVEELLGLVGKMKE